MGSRAQIKSGWRTRSSGVQRSTLYVPLTGTVILFFRFGSINNPESRVSTVPSLITQRNDRVHARGSTCGDVTSKEYHDANGSEMAANVVLSNSLTPSRRAAINLEIVAHADVVGNLSHITSDPKINKTAKPPFDYVSRRDTRHLGISAPQKKTNARLP